MGYSSGSGVLLISLQRSGQIHSVRLQIQWNLYPGDTLGTEASVPLIEVLLE